MSKEEVAQTAATERATGERFCRWCQQYLPIDGRWTKSPVGKNGASAWKCGKHPTGKGK